MAVSAGVAISLALTACAPDDTLAGWRDEAIETCEASADEFATMPGVVDPDGPTSVSDIAVELSQKRLDALLSIEFPEGREEDVAVFTDLMQETQDNLIAISAALAEGDDDTFQKLNAESVEVEA